MIILNILSFIGIDKRRKFKSICQTKVGLNQVHSNKKDAYISIMTLVMCHLDYIDVMVDIKVCLVTDVLWYLMIFVV